MITKSSIPPRYNIKGIKLLISLILSFESFINVSIITPITKE